MLGGRKERQEMVDRRYCLSVRKQCDLLCVNRSNLYYSPQKERYEFNADDGMIKST